MVDLTEYISKESKRIYIFLDIDGVLNNENYIVKCYEKHHKPMHMNHVPFNPVCLENLMTLTQTLERDGFEISIILSSTWRLHEIDYEIVDARLAEYGMCLCGKTPYEGNVRGEEIKQYLDNIRYKCYNFIILDDDKNDIEPYFPNNLVRTDFKTGFTEDCLNKCLKLVYKEGRN